MTDWCSNTGHIVAPTQDLAIAFERELKAGNLINHYLPVDDDDGGLAQQGIPRWIQERQAKWGVTREVDPDDADIIRDGCRLAISIETAWNPPSGFYRHLIVLGFRVDATWVDPNMLRGGRFTNERDEIWSFACDRISRKGLCQLYKAFGVWPLRSMFGDDYGNTDDC